MVCTFRPQSWPDPWEDVHRIGVEFALSAHLMTTRDWADPQFGFSRVNLDFSAPAHADVYTEIFGCEIAFDQRNSGYEHVRNDGPRRLADARSCAMASEMCAKLLEEIASADSIAANVRRALIERPGFSPRLDEMAARMGTYSRALRRRLAADGTSYRRLVAEVQARLAIEYLRHTGMTSEEIAKRLGYGDAANFRRAFIGWTGRSPSDYRRNVID